MFTRCLLSAYMILRALQIFNHWTTKFFLNFYLFIYFWLCWVFVSVRGVSPAAASRGHCSSRCTGLSLLRPLLLQSTGSRCTGSVVVAHGPSRSAAFGIFPDQGSNPCPLHWQADSQPLRHQGSPWTTNFKERQKHQKVKYLAQGRTPGGLVAKRLLLTQIHEGPSRIIFPVLLWVPFLQGLSPSMWAHKD